MPATSCSFSLSVGFSIKTSRISRYTRQALHLTEVRPKSVVLIVQIAQIISDGRTEGRTDEGLTISRQTQGT